MKNWYTIFDMTPYDENGKSYIQVGLAPINHQSVIAESRYDANQTGYSPLNQTDDASHVIAPFANQYPGLNGVNIPDGPVQSGKEKFQNWFHHNGLYVAIGGGILVLFLLIVISCLCYKKYNKEDPYKTAKYTEVDEEVIRLDEDRKNSNEDHDNDRLNESKGMDEGNYQ